MKSWAWIIALLVAFCVAACVTSDRESPEPVESDPPGADAAGASPLLSADVRDSTPAAAVDPAAPRGRYVPPPEEELPLNDRCFVCHETYKEEELTEMHAEGDVGCEDCHGASDAHCSDEDNVTPPDTMYPLEKVNEFCAAECHEDWVELSEEHEAVADGTETEYKYCTDCHGEHRLTTRRTTWDKVTGEVIE